MQPPEIPDHDLLRLIGRGAYGEVWLARNVMGIMRAVKIVRRDSFDGHRPFDREFAAVKRYEPVSRQAAGLVNVLHAGRAADDSHFHYVMELADSAEAGVDAAAEPDRYVPCTLRTQITRMGRLPVAECLEIAVSLTNGMADLHRTGLVHRDVKPSNIIFSGGRAKLADIGLLGEIAESRSFVGTEGYVPPEGPGRPAADLFALGRVLYEASTGYEASRFPALPPEWAREGNAGAFEFYEIVLRCCEPDAARRYSSADELLADLTLLQSGQSVRQVRQLRRRIRVLRKIAAAAAVAGVLGMAVAWWQRGEAAAQRRLVERAERAEAEARQNLFTGLVQQARNARRNGEPDARFTALDLLERAAALQPGEAELREEFIAALATPGLRRLPSAARQTPALNPVHDAELLSCLGATKEGELIVLDNLKGTVTASRPGDALPQPVRPVLLGRDGLRLYAEDGTGALHLAVRGQPDRVLRPAGEGKALWSATKDGGTLLAWQESGSVTVIHPEQDAESRQVWHCGAPFRPGYSHPARLSADGSTAAFAVVEGHEVLLHRTADGSVAHRLQSAHALSGAVDISADGSVIAAGFANGRIGVWRTAAPGFCEEIDAGVDFISGLSLTPDGRFLVSTSWGASGYLWDLADGTRLSRVPLPAGFPSFSADGRRLILDTGIAAVLYEFAAGEVCRSVVLARAAVRSRGPVQHFTLHPQGPWILTSSEEGIQLTDAAAATVLRRWPLPAAHALFSPDGSGFYLSGRTCTWVPISRTAEGGWEAGVPKLLDLRPPDGEVQTSAISTDGRIFAGYCSDGHWLLVRRLPESATVTRLPMIEGTNAFFSLTPDGSQLGCGMRYGGAAVISTEDGKVVQRFSGAGSWTSAAFSADGRFFAIGDATGIRMHESGTWRQLWHSPVEANGDVGRPVWFLSGSRWTAACGRAGFITLLDTASGKEIVSLRRERDTIVSDVALSGDGSMLWMLDLSGQTLWRWDLHTLRAALRARGLDWTDDPLPPPIPATAPPAGGLVFLLPEKK